MYEQFDKFGMEIHAAPEGKAEESKSEVMFIPSPPSTYEYVDLVTTPPPYVSLPEEGAPIGEGLTSPKWRLEVARLHQLSFSPCAWVARSTARARTNPLWMLG